MTVVSASVFIDLDIPPLVPPGLRVKSHSGSGILEICPDEIELYRSDRQMPGFIPGPDLLVEIHQLPDRRVLSATVGDYFIAHPEVIPSAWNGFSIFFFGTTYISTQGTSGEYIRYIFRTTRFENEMPVWSSADFRLDYHWNENNPVALGPR